MGKIQAVCEQYSNQISEWTRIANVSEATDGVSLGLQNETTDDLLTFYEYDVFDRLVKIEQGADVIENAYTADGKKLSRITNGVLTYYVYDGNVVIEEQNEGNDETARIQLNNSLLSSTSLWQKCCRLVFYKIA